MTPRYRYDAQAAARKIAEENNPVVRNQDLARVPTAYRRMVNELVSMMFRGRVQR